MFAIRSIGAMLFACVAVSASAEGLSLYGDSFLDAPLAAAAPADSSLVSTNPLSYSIPSDMTSIKFAATPTLSMSNIEASSPSAAVGFRHTVWQAGSSLTATVDLIHESPAATLHVAGTERSTPTSIGLSIDSITPALNRSATFDMPLIGKELIERGWQVEAIGGLPR